MLLNLSIKKAKETMPEINTQATMPSMASKIHLNVTAEELLGVINHSKELTEQTKEIVKDLLDKHSGEEFRTLSEFLNIGFSPEMVEVLQSCNEIIQLFL